ncbi:hypothetical protein D3C71_1556180 [compost metagenome]
MVLEVLAQQQAHAVHMHVGKAGRIARHMHAQHLHSGARAVALEPGAIGADDGLFDEQDGMRRGEARHELLRALVHKIPAQVRKNQKACHGRT